MSAFEERVKVFICTSYPKSFMGDLKKGDIQIASTPSEAI